MDREILLGYLMDALEDDEVGSVERELFRNPAVRQELEELRKELVPLSKICRDAYAPPWGLAERTCAGLWTQIDRAANHSEASVPQAVQPVSASVPSPHWNRLNILGEILAANPSDVNSNPVHSPIHETSVAVNSSPSAVATEQTTPARSGRSASSRPAERRKRFDSVRPLPKISGDTRPAETTKGWRLADLLASVAVGMLVAVIAFLPINYAKNRTRTIVTQSKINEFENKVALYAGLEGAPAIPVDPESQQPSAINLAKSNWSKINPNGMSLLTVGNNSHVGLLQSSPGAIAPFNLVSNQPAQLDEQFGRTVYLGQEPNSQETTKPSTTLFNDVERIIPVSNGSLVQPAYGQNIRFSDGNVFFRVLPIFEKNPVEVPVEQQRRLQ